MNDDSEIRILIAEACGWTDFVESYFDGLPAGTPPNWSGMRYQTLPDYPNDLNAMREAEEKHLTFSQALRWPEVLRQVVQGHYNHGEIQFEVYRATARQRAEAFLKTIGKWKE